MSSAENRKPVSVAATMKSSASSLGLVAAPALATNALAELTASEFLSLLKSRQVTVMQYVQSCIDRIEQYEPKIRAWRAFDAGHVMDRVRRIEAASIERRPPGQMNGVPVGVKDIFNTYDYPTSMGSAIMDGYTPGNDARVVSNIRLEDGIVMGKTVTAEFAVHHPGPTLNPYDLTRSPGTSSSGSAAAVATRMVPVALASQTAGSIIRPASYCGVYGYKPSFGLIPRTGVLKTTDTLDTIGFMARSIADLRLMFEVCRVRGHNYPVSERAINDPSRQSVGKRPWRVGIVRGPKTEFETAEARAGIDAVVARLAAAGCETFLYSLPAAFDEAHETHERIYRRALAYYFDLEWNADAKLFSPVMQAMIDSGRAIAPGQYQADVSKQRDLAKLMDGESERYDVLIGLSTAGEAPVGLDGKDLPDHCLIWTMCGLPALSVPMLTGAGGLPVGVQIVARRFNDYLLLDFAELLVRAAA